MNGLYKFIRNIQPYSFNRNIHPCSFLEKFTPTRLLDTYSPLLVYYISRKIPVYSLIRAYSFIRELRVLINNKLSGFSFVSVSCKVLNCVRRVSALHSRIFFVKSQHLFLHFRHLTSFSRLHKFIGDFAY